MQELYVKEKARCVKEFVSKFYAKELCVRVCKPLKHREWKTNEDAGMT